MIVVVADTSPLNYLVQIDCQGLLPALFERVLVPRVVIQELAHARRPEGDALAREALLGHTQNMRIR